MESHPACFSAMASGEVWKIPEDNVRHVNRKDDTLW